MFDALIRSARGEGVASLWRGFPPTVLRAIAMNVGMMVSYDSAKDWATTFNGAGMSTNLLSAAISGVSAAFLSLPFDMLKTRLQNMKVLVVILLILTYFYIFFKKV